MDALSVSRLRLTDFRCYDRAQLDLDSRPVVLTGPNGAGKTNLLEAVSFLAPGRGLRRSRPEEICRRGAEASGWAVAATIASAAEPIEIGTGRRGEGGRRAIRINGATAPSQAALTEHVSMIWLIPQMDRLFLEGASGRRRFLDRLVFGFDAAHAGRINAYEHALRERARLLRERTADTAWLDTLEGVMAERGVAIAAARREMMALLAQFCTNPPGPFPGAAVAVTGMVEGWLDEGPALAAEDAFRAALRASREQDAASGGAAAGPHRSDLVVRHRETGLPARQCSTGEQKALLIAIILAHAQLLAAERGRAPLLLLDEVAAHLDAAHREALVEEILALGIQAWMTGTDRTLFESLDDRAQFYAVQDGALRLAQETRQPARRAAN
jgi:DNA replication and repair protein RecF